MSDATAPESAGRAGTEALACVTGRFQPVHNQHLELMRIALSGADHLLVGLTNPDAGTRREEPSSAHRHTEDGNPFTFFERSRLITAALTADGWDGRFTIVPFDLFRPESWYEYVPSHARHFVRSYSAWEERKAGLLADGGYLVERLVGEPDGRISGSDIRARIDRGDPWEELVPPAVVAPLRALAAARRGADSAGRPR
ncbi:hypothetical protein GCM10022222_07260 [Amycolatopsis ultiminotia]|uniref:Cytidyltransferase-like domain-containing protein n=1 Tax=Amycolatopsis ultiminotia TaxID=543629 RepID=A0ABP6V4H2_9PSEU